MQKYKLFAKVGSQFCQILNSYTRNGQKLLKCCPSGEISPNMVTLVSSQSKWCPRLFIYLCGWFVWTFDYPQIKQWQPQHLILHFNSRALKFYAIFSLDRLREGWREESRFPRLSYFAKMFQSFFCSKLLKSRLFQIKNCQNEKIQIFCLKLSPLWKNSSGIDRLWSLTLTDFQEGTANY